MPEMPSEETLSPLEKFRDEAAEKELGKPPVTRKLNYYHFGKVKAFKAGFDASTKIHAERIKVLEEALEFYD